MGCCLCSHLLSFPSITEVFSFSLRWNISEVLKAQMEEKEEVLHISFQNMCDLLVICCAEEQCELNLIDYRMLLLQPDHFLLLDIVRSSC